jgi:putative ABC transport system permease protein
VIIGWLRGHSVNGGIAALGHVPVANLLVILIGLPLVATTAGWLLAGRQPSGIARQPVE